jgi:DNA polymerase III epsilon subunit-like protein
MNDLLRFNYDQKYLIVDTETDGLNLVNTKPWQVSWITAKGKQIKSKHDHFLKWDELNVSAGAARVTGFEYETYIKKAEDPLKVLNQFWEFLSDPSYIIIGQNFLGFDVYAINSWRKWCGLKPDFSYIERVIDTRSLAMAIGIGHKLMPKGDIHTQYRFLNYRDKKIKSSQGYLLKQYNIEHDPLKLHNALYDIEMTFKIFWQQIQQIDI